MLFPGSALADDSFDQPQVQVATSLEAQGNSPEQAVDDGQGGLSDGGLDQTQYQAAATSLEAESDTPEWAVDDSEGELPDDDTQAPLPATFDQRDQGIVTPVKYQNPWGSCWAFGGVSAAETSILTAIGATYDEYPIDLSERHLTYFAITPISELVDSAQAGEGLHTFDTSPNAPFDAGGNPAYITTLFGQGIGPVLEEMFPYRGKDGITSLDYFDSLSGDELAAFMRNELGPTAESMGMNYDDFMAFVATARGMTQEETFDYFKQVIRNTYVQSNSYSKSDDWSIPEQNAEGGLNRLISHGITLLHGNVLPSYWNTDKTELNPAGIRAIKEELLSGLGVSIMYRADQTGTYTMSTVDENGNSRNDQYNQYWDDSTQQPNHGVAVIGWDDNYPASNFNPAHQPPADGAWIVKNSWGSTADATEDDLGNVVGKRAYGIQNAEGEYTGCFYLSYYDKTITQPEMMEFSSTMNDSNGFYALQHDYMPAASGFYKTPMSEDVESAANVFVMGEDILLRDVTTRTPEANMTTTFAIYVLDDDSQDPADGTLVYRSSQTFKYAGYHRVTLEQPIPVKAGSYFSVVTTSSLTDENGKRTYGVSANQGATKEAVEKYRAQGVPIRTYSQAVVNDGESFLYINGEWQDWTDYLATSSDMEECGVDNFSIKVFAEPKPYTLEHVDAVAATCTEAGNIEYWYDTTLDKCYKDEAGTEEIASSDTVVAALGHAWGAWAKLDDEQHQRTCENDASHVEEAAHEWGEGEVAKEASATESGVRIFTCRICGATRTETIPPSGSKGSENGVSNPASVSTAKDGGKASSAKPMPQTGDDDVALMTLLVVAMSSAALTLYARRSYCRREKEVR